MNIVISVLALVIPGIIAGVVSYYSNKQFYRKVKTELDKDIERHKISYGGIFKERVEIYRSVLKHLIEVRNSLTKAKASNTEKDVTEVMTKLNQFNYFIRINRPFLTEDIASQVGDLMGRYRKCSDAFIQYAFVTNNDVGKMATDKVKENYLVAVTTLSSMELILIEDQIIRQMRNDLQMS